MTVHSASGRDVAFLAHRVRKSEILPVYLEVNCRNFNFVWENLFFTRFWPRSPTKRFVLRQNFFFSKKHQWLTLFPLFSVKFIRIRIGHNFEHLKGCRWQCTRHPRVTSLFWLIEYEIGNSRCRSRVQLSQFQFRFGKRISHKILTPFAYKAIRSATEFFLAKKHQRLTLFHFFRWNLFEFELGIISNIWRGVDDSALGIHEWRRFSGS